MTTTNPQGPESNRKLERVSRGNSWNCAHMHTSSRNRWSYESKRSYRYLGFRVLCYRVDP